MHEKKALVKFIDLLSKRPSRRCLFPGLKHGAPRAARVPLNTDLNSSRLHACCSNKLRGTSSYYKRQDTTPLIKQSFLSFLHLSHSVSRAFMVLFRKRLLIRSVRSATNDRPGSLTFLQLPLNYNSRGTPFYGLYW